VCQFSAQQLEIYGHHFYVGKVPKMMHIFTSLMTDQWLVSTGLGTLSTVWRADGWITCQNMVWQYLSLLVFIVQMKHNLEQDLENMQNEIDQLQAQLERGDNYSDLEEMAMSDEGNAEECEKIATLFPEASESAECNAVEQGAVPDDVKEIFTVPENIEDWPELSANTLKMCESMMRQPRDPVAGPRQQTASENMDLSVEDDAGRLVNAECEFVEASGRAMDIQGGGAASLNSKENVVSVVSLANDSALPVNVSAAGLMASESSGYADGMDQESLSAVPDSLDRTPTACDAAAVDIDSYLSCEEDIVIPDSQEDLYSSPPCTVLAARRDEPSHFNALVQVSYNDGRGQFEEVADGEHNDEASRSSALLLNATDCEPVASAETIRHDSLAVEHVKADWSVNREECGRQSEHENSRPSLRNSEHNKLASQQSNHVIDISSEDTTKSTVCADDLAEDSRNLSNTEELIDELIQSNSALCHQQLETTAKPIVPEQFPKRPHWKFVVSGISPRLDQVLTLLVNRHHHYALCPEKRSLW